MRPLLQPLTSNDVSWTIICKVRIVILWAFPISIIINVVLHEINLNLILDLDSFCHKI